MTRYTYDTNVYMGKDRQNATQLMTAIHVTWKMDGVGHELYMDNFFSSPDIFDDLYTGYHLLCNCQTKS